MMVLMSSPLSDKIIVALDGESLAHNRELIRELSPVASFFKVGLGSLADGAFDMVRDLKGAGKKVFLDLKLFDIGQTIERAVTQLMDLQPDFITVQGDPPVVQAAMRGRAGASTKILAVTFLTSLDRTDLDAMMVVQGDTQDLVVERARRALAAGADGVIASPLEVMTLRNLPETRGKLIVTPGVRPVGASLGDQKRVATPFEALSAGADHVVVGRPVIAAVDPKAAFAAILKGL